MIRTFLAMRNVSPGFVQPEDILTMRITIPSAVIKDAAQVARTHEQIVRRLQGDSRRAVRRACRRRSRWTACSSNDPIFVEDFPRNDGLAAAAAPVQVDRRGLLRNDGQPRRSPAATITWADVHNAAPVDDGQRELRARVLGRTGQGDGAADSPESQGPVARDHRRCRERAPGRRHSGGPGHRLLADGDQDSSGATRCSCSEGSATRFARHDCTRPAS